jgi:succinoglycan biosynthesis protein ExoA
VSDAPSWPLGDDPDGWPTVSVVMPIRNEAPHLDRAVAAVLAQEYPRPFEVCLAVGPSSDDTEALAAQLAANHDRVVVVSNFSGVTPAGLNAAIGATSGEVVVRVDGHSQLSPGYIRRAVETMARTGAVNVGGVQSAIGETPFEQAVAAAMTSWLGTGGSRFHVGGAEGPVDTVYLGVFRRQAIEAVGLFDEHLVRNQDYELNIRLRKAGGTVWFDPELSVTYRPRGSLRALAKQYFEYGWWKAEVARMHPASLKARQLAPVVVTVVAGLGALIGLRRRRFLIGPLAYASGVALVAARSSHRGNDPGWRLGGVAVIMHLAWGLGFAGATLSRPGVRGRTQLRRYDPAT